MPPAYSSTAARTSTPALTSTSTASAARPRYFHSLAHFTGTNPEITQLLIDRGADLTIRARVPGHGEHSGTLLDVSATEYAATLPTRFPL